MKQYPKIYTIPNGRATVFHVFDKLDGSNIRVEWSRKKGFCKFGTRKRLLGSDQGILIKAGKMAKAVEAEFSQTLGIKLKLDQATCFFEFHGPNSFAGSHEPSDEHRLTLIDVSIYKRGMMPPDEFRKAFYRGAFDVPNLLGRHPIDEDFKTLVRGGELQGMTFEGVVCKAKPDRKWAKPNMFKIKNQAWIDKVKAQYDPSRWKEIL